MEVENGQVGRVLMDSLFEKGFYTLYYLTACILIYDFLGLSFVPGIDSTQQVGR